MTESSCIFCKIINKEIPASFVKENDNVIVVKDLYPKAPIHYLIIPKKHIKNIQSLSAQDREIAADILFMAQELAETLPKPTAFKLVSNNGTEPGQGQHIFHIHVHFLAGKLSDL